MPTPASITFKTVHGQILALDGSGTPAIGTVTFRSLVTVRDTTDNIVFGPTIIKATLNATGEFTVSLAATNDANLDPNGWSWEATIDTDVLKTVLFLPVSESGPTPIEFADVVVTDGPSGGFGFYTATEVDALLATKVAKAGDTMTGDLILSGAVTDLTVGGVLNGTFGGVTGNYLEMVAMGLSTGVLFGGEVNVNGSNPQAFDIGAFTGYIVDTITTPGSPTLVRVATTSTTTVALDGPALAREITWILVDSTGAVVQQATRPTNTQLRTHLQLGAVEYDAGSSAIVTDQSLPVTLMHPVNQLYDLMIDLGPFNVSGNVISASAANLTFAKSAGVVFAPSFNYFNGPLLTNDPHRSDIAAQNPVTFRHLTRSTGAASTTTVLDVGHYDLNGVITVVGGGVNASTIFRVFAAVSNTVANQVFVQYGQRFYSSLAEAQAAIAGEPYVVLPGLTDNATLIGHICAIRTATDLTNTAQASFHPVGKFQLS